MREGARVSRRRALTARVCRNLDGAVRLRASRCLVTANVTDQTNSGVLPQVASLRPARFLGASSDCGRRRLEPVDFP